MKRIMMLSVVTSSLILAGGDIAPVEVEAVAPTAEAFTFFNNVTAKGEIRPRYEFVDTDDAVRNASAFTNRLTLGISADLFQVDGLSTYLEATNVSGSGDYWDLSNGDIGDKGVYNVVADPSQTRITQAYIDYASGKTLIRAGRQGVNLDNQRFIGTVNWRQMPQTYDAAAVINNSVENLSLLAAYVWHVNTIFDEDTVKPVGDGFDTGTVLLHASYKMMDALTLTGYAYMIEDIHDTYGIAATGKFALGAGTGLSYRAEYASQTDPSFEDLTTNKTADADYINVEATLNMSGFLAGARYEVLGAGNGGNAAFSTPLATLHGQNGWADMFLGTPDDGLVDVNGMIGYKAKGFGVAKIVYHDFSSDRGNTDYGTETDVLYKNKISAVKGLSGMLKASFYSADAYKVDTTKYWVMLDYKF
ncbi:MAG: alginate export family protein [Epsilonproteobacteria bacterium]|nr:alginate export family protein [Campylobacterota bacterium]